ncbi:hypothetical protein UPYG_G00151370 [Umbra pygmaea]|uniref:Uncharacterized protein n=1 Tax=Umbra pygmaea TaxID=75934 RepID=A0ABD0X1I5_UMBPY
MADLMLILRMYTLVLMLGYSEAKMEIISSKVDVLEGEEHMLLCKAGGEGEITWQKDGEDVEDNVEKVDETTSKLTIRNARISDAGRYVCVCVFDTGHRDDTSYTIYVYTDLSFKDTPTYHEFLEGQDAVIPCKVTGLPAVEVNWKRSNQMVQLVAGHIGKLTDGSLQIKNISREDKGSYTCEGRIRNRPIFKELIISIVVNVSPKVRVLEEVKKVKAGPETNVSLVCLVEGVPKPNITWTIPGTSDESRYKYNSDKSELTILSVVRQDYGEYTCWAKNKLGESIAMIMLDVSEHPQALVNQTEMKVELGQGVSVSCTISGHPMPTLYWARKTRNDQPETVVDGEGRVRVEDGYVLVIDSLEPSDGGLYTCLAISAAGNASTDFSLQTWPGKAYNVTAAPGQTSVHFTIGETPVDGGSIITHYLLQWKTGREKEWQQRLVQFTDPLVITHLIPYTSYSVRLAAQNNQGPGAFSDVLTVRTQGIREPDKPVLGLSEVKIDGNTFSIPLKQLDDGGSPLIQYIVQYKNELEEDWRVKKLPSNSTAINLHDLQYNSEYHMEVMAVNVNGSSSPVEFIFKVQQPVPIARLPKSVLGKGAVAGIVMLIFMVLVIAVDVTCCYTNRCGMLMFLAVRLCGEKVPGMKTVEDGDGTSNRDMKLNGIGIQRDSISKLQTQNGEKNSMQAEVTCDKAPLTKFEKTPPNRDPATEA